MNLIESKSSLIALFFNGQLAHIINPWVLTVDYENETITVKKRNWYFIGINKNIIAFRFIRNIRVDEHLFGANISIKATGVGLKPNTCQKVILKHSKTLYLNTIKVEIII